MVIGSVHRNVEVARKSFQKLLARVGFVAFRTTLPPEEPEVTEKPKAEPVKKR